ncbi:MAG TPA: hypothetical protein VMR81_05765 [Patescibacteria group bacterium]|nr:hypothetical protein [Patescibacteria group bacterium]
MHRNTYFVVTFLAVFAALVVGVNIGKKFTGQNAPPIQPSPTASPTLASIPLSTYTNSECGATLEFPSTLTKLEDGSGSAVLVNQTDTKQSILITCQDSIPRPPLDSNKIVQAFVPYSTGTGSVAATLYHDSSAKDGTPVDDFIVRIPKTTLDFYLSGFGTAFDDVVKSIRLTH